MNLWEIEDKLKEEGCSIICGVDEAGRGPLAGPVCAAAVILPHGTEIAGLNDSKKLSAKKREALYYEIISCALSYGICMTDEKVIDDINILNATFAAMNGAISKLSITPDIALIDGNRDGGIECRSMCVVGGDGKSALIAAASILAKVTRDRYMMQMAAEYPEYAFEKHKGYGTKLHYERIRQFGPCEIHRKTFLRKMH